LVEVMGLPAVEAEPARVLGDCLEDHRRVDGGLSGGHRLVRSEEHEAPRVGSGPTHTGLVGHAQQEVLGWRSLEANASAPHGAGPTNLLPITVQHAQRLSERAEEAQGRVHALDHREAPFDTLYFCICEYIEYTRERQP